MPKKPTKTKAMRPATSKTSRPATSKTPRPVTSKPPRPATRTVVIFGLDKERKPHAARFTGENDALLAKAAAVMGMRLAVPVSKRHFEIVGKLPAGKIHATGDGLVPNVDQPLYDQIISLVGGDPGAITASLPKSPAQLAPGHLVIAQATVEDGWWPAIVIKRSSEAVTLRWRDFPGEPELVRPISALALLNTD